MIFMVRKSDKACPIKLRSTCGPSPCSRALLRPMQVWSALVKVTSIRIPITIQYNSKIRTRLVRQPRACSLITNPSTWQVRILRRRLPKTPTSYWLTLLVSKKRLFTRCRRWKMWEILALVSEWKKSTSLTFHFPCSSSRKRSFRPSWPKVAGPNNFLKIRLLPGRVPQSRPHRWVRRNSSCLELPTVIPGLVN